LPSPGLLCCLAASLWAAGGAASPWDDPLQLAVMRHAQGEQAPVFVGDGEWAGAGLAWKLSTLPEATAPGTELPCGSLPASLCAALRPELLALSDPMQAVVTLEPTIGGSWGQLTPINDSGDEEPGAVSLRAGAQLRAYTRGLEVLLEPELGLDLGPGLLPPGLVPRQAWGAWRGEHLLVGFGMRDRWLGPGRHGALLLSDNARAAPMGTVAARGKLPGALEGLGRWRFESSWGWLQRPRDDVGNPGLMLMDLRWIPVPWIELGATRMGLFGGQGRPLPGLFELLVPLEPHTYDDPEKEEPDQNELASLDFRVSLPLARWVGGPVDRLEGWWQYGAEDIIARRLGAVPYPSLAGVANLWGLGASAGPWQLSYEGAHIFDDYFRWYLSHRIYHQGFTQDGRVLGHHSGGDAWTSWVRLGWYPLPWGADLAWARQQRVGIVESLEGNLLALSTDEIRSGLTARLWRFGGSGSRWVLDVGVSRVQGEGFVPELDGWEHRVGLAWTGNL
jgi:hypothetical protein